MSAFKSYRERLCWELRLGFHVVAAQDTGVNDGKGKKEAH